MVKSTIFIKKFLALFLVVLMSVDSFAAIISDSDGAAFVTKEEFETMKKDFDAQIERYNRSIDNKINGKISDYLYGINVSGEQSVESNIGFFGYPLTIINKQKIIDNCTDDQATSCENQELWSPGLTLYTNGHRHPVMFTQKFEWGCTDLIKDYLNGTVDEATGTFKVTDICYMPTLNVQNVILHENCGDNDTPEKEFANSFFMDNDGLERPGTQSGYWFKRGGVLANYAKLWKASTYKPHFSSLHHAASGADSYPSNQNKYGQDEYDRVHLGGQYLYFTHNYSNYWRPDDLITTTYYYTQKKINVCYNYGDSTNNSHFAPTTQAYDLYFTNKKGNRHDKRFIKSLQWTWRTISNSDVHDYAKWVITDGANLERENENTTRKWNNKSLISADRLIYDIDLPDGSRIANHKMVNGIPIFYAANEYNTTLFSNFKISFNMTTTKSNNKKYLVVSKSPITVQNYNENIEQNDDYLTIERVGNKTINGKKAELSAGTNMVVLADYVGQNQQILNPGEMLYMKILWDDSDDEKITITRPVINFRPES